MIESLPLLQHYQAHTGEHRGTESKPHNGSRHQYSLERFDHPSADMVTITSNGLRYLETDVPFGEELACTLRKSQAGYARVILGAMCEFVTQRRKGIEYGQIMADRKELFDGSDKEGLLAATHPYFDQKFNYLTHDSSTDVANGNVALQIITLIPITRAEIDLATSRTDALYEHWNTSRPDLFDITRPSTL